MAAEVPALETVLGYKFKNRALLVEALTHSSVSGVPSYNRLEFMGDAILGAALCSHLFIKYDQLDPGQLTLLKSANLSTEKLARVAVRHGLFRYLHHTSKYLEDIVSEFTEVVSQEDGAIIHGGSLKAPKVLADIVESIAAAVYIDLGYDLQYMWSILSLLLEPIITPDDLVNHPQPVTTLFTLCQKMGKQIHINHNRENATDVARVYVDGVCVASGSSVNKVTAKLNAAKMALQKMGTKKTEDNKMTLICINGDDSSDVDVESSKHKLHQLCVKNKLLKPVYTVKVDVLPAHNKKFECTLVVCGTDFKIEAVGRPKSKVKDAEKSAASLMLCFLENFRSEAQ